MSILTELTSTRSSSITLETVGSSTHNTISWVDGISKRAGGTGRGWRAASIFCAVDSWEGISFKASQTGEVGAARSTREGTGGLTCVIFQDVACWASLANCGRGAWSTRQRTESTTSGNAEGSSDTAETVVEIVRITNWASLQALSARVSPHTGESNLTAICITKSCSVSITGLTIGSTGLTCSIYRSISKFTFSTELVVLIADQTVAICTLKTWACVEADTRETRKTDRRFSGGTSSTCFMTGET